MVSCEKYADAWPGFFALIEKFWPEHKQYGRCVITDTMPEDRLPEGWGLFAAGEGSTWCRAVADFCELQHDFVMVFQEDMFVNARVNQEHVGYALNQLTLREAAALRLYPCPGADEDYGDPLIGKVSRGSDYRISCQLSVWNPRFLAEIACRCNTPQEFEISGTRYAAQLPGEVLAWKREAEPWPVSYICSAICAGRWDPNAKKLCDSLSIPVDWSKRGMARTPEGVTCL